MNDNDPLPFLTLAAITRNVMQFLTKRNDETENEREAHERQENERAEAQAKRREILVVA